MATVYSTRLFASPPQYTTGEFRSVPVPAGFVWVVRDISLLNVIAQVVENVNSILVSLAPQNAPGTPLFATPFFQTMTQVLYRWQGRGVLLAGEQIVLNTSSQGWSWTIDGYQLNA